MGFKQPSLDDVYSTVRKMASEINSPYNDGFTGLHCKQELYKLKCWLEDLYDDLPNFTGEEEWEQDRIIQILKKRPKNDHI